MNKIKIEIWGREFILDIDYECYYNEEVTSLQTETLEKLLSDFNCITNTEAVISDYCIKNNPNHFLDGKMDNIFKYVMPKSIFIKRNTTNHAFALLCDYKFDIEHGLAIVFEEGKYKTIGPEDIIL